MGYAGGVSGEVGVEYHVVNFRPAEFHLRRQVLFLLLFRTEFLQHKKTHKDSFSSDAEVQNLPNLSEILFKVVIGVRSNSIDIVFAM